MVIDKLTKHIEEWAPPGVAQDRDNVGLLVGSGDDVITNVFLCLELSPTALKEAIDNKCNLIFTHHPLIFNPIKRINPAKDDKAAMIAELIKNNVALYSAHTNLDFTKEGVSYQLAHALKLKDIKFLRNFSSNQFKLVLFVPEENLDKVADAIFNAGGGIIGEYSNCSYRLKGEGTFKGSEESNPAIGKKEKFEKVDEVRLEVIVNSWNLSKVIKEMLKVHPYEEPAYDIYPLKNQNPNYGEGVVGILPEEMEQSEFLEYVCKSINAKGIRYCKGKSRKINKVALCGGSGANLIQDAIASGADAYVTADIKYHSFQDAENKILLVDAGHYETEIHSLNAVKVRMETFFAAEKENIKVNLFTGTTNPIDFFKYKE